MEPEAPPAVPAPGPVRAADSLTPREIVRELDRHVVGQAAAKRAVAIALRNRVRRQRLAPELRDEVVPKNIIMIGPTGVGKTEIARRLARLTGSPFLKVEASKFTEVGYVGRDAESIVRDLADVAVKMERESRMVEVEPKAREAAEERLLELLLPPSSRVDAVGSAGGSPEDALRSTRDKLREQLRAGKLEGRRVELEVQERQTGGLSMLRGPGMEEMDLSGLRDMLPGLFGGRTRRRKVTVGEARELLVHEEGQKLIDMDAVARAALERVEQSGIVFLDEIDKVAGREAQGRGPDVSREGVQRDLLPIIEGTTVNTKYGMVRTDHVLFIAAGAFHVSRPSDLIPELQGRFPIRVELEPLTKGDFVRILTEPQGALIKQYEALLATEGLTLEFDGQAIELIAEYAAMANERAENIGARRLATVMERLLDPLSFEAPERSGERVRIDAAYVRERLEGVVKDPDLARYIL